MDKNNTLLVIDNGTQYGWLYRKRFTDIGIDVDTFDAGIYNDEDGNLVRPRINLEDVEGYAGVVIAGGRSSVTVDDELRVDIDPRIYSDFSGPLLGTCFGHQDMADRLGGEVISDLKHCGPVYTKVNVENPFFNGLESKLQRVNSTHNDGVLTVPPGFEIIAFSQSEPIPKSTDTPGQIDAMYKKPDEGKNNHRIGTQFHPETFLTENGNQMLQNFIILCGLEVRFREPQKEYTPNVDIVLEEQLAKIKQVVGNNEVFLPISGGIDSTVSTRLLLESGIDPNKIHAFHIDTGFNRLGESEEVVKEYHKMGWNFVELLDKKDYFANFSLDEDELRDDLKGRGYGGITLKDAVFSEHKRYLFQTAYAKVIEEYQESLGLNFTNSVLVQGTNQADKVESGRGSQKGRGSAHIKSHHNVGDFINKYAENGNLLEPLEVFFKSDIYEIGNRYDLPGFFSTRKPFPGLGLLIRMGTHNMVASGMYSRDDIRELSDIANKYSDKFKMKVHVTPIEAVGTCGDERAEGIISILQYNDNHESKVNASINDLLYVAGQLPHYTTKSNNNCITRIITPLFGFEEKEDKTFTVAKNDSKTIGYLQLFDDEVNKIVDRFDLKMTQVVNYMINDNLGEDGKYTFVFRPWLAPDLMSGMPAIPEEDKRILLFDELRKLKEKHDFIGNICIDLTYKPIGGTEIN